MTRTTVDINPTILKELKARAALERKSLGEVISEIAAVALVREELPPARPFVWNARSMQARIDLSDLDVVYRTLGEAGQ
ncbi:MAG: antitoxin [Actinomycetota bacterium]